MYAHLSPPLSARVRSGVGEMRSGIGLVNPNVVRVTKDVEHLASCELISNPSALRMNLGVMVRISLQKVVGDA